MSGRATATWWRRGLLVLFLTGPALLYAAVPNGGPDLITGSYIAQLMGGLLLVVALIVLLAWLLRRISGSGGTSRQLIDILAIRSVGTRERLLLVQVGEEQLLLGVAPSGIRCLHRLRHPIVPPTPAPPTGLDFASLLRTRLTQNSEA